MEREFVYWRSDSTVSAPVKFKTIIKVARRRIRAGLFTVTQNGDALRPEKQPRSETFNLLRKYVTQAPVGSDFRVRPDGESVVFRVRVVAPEIELIETNGNRRADVYWSTIVATFPQYHPRFAGAYVCKTVSGTSILSQHSYGNAVDIFFDSFAHQEAAADWVATQDDLHAEHVISGDRIWARGWHAYTGDFHSHLHVDFDPQYSGSCGVRG